MDSLTSGVGSFDIFISKLDASGNLVWAKNTGSVPGGIGQSIAVDAASNVYTTGYFGGTADFDPGVGIYNLTSAGGADVFITKLDVSGNFVWAKNMGSASGDDDGYLHSCRRVWVMCTPQDILIVQEQILIPAQVPIILHMLVDLIFLCLNWMHPAILYGQKVWVVLLLNMVCP